ncbi:retron St85 family effector protein [Acerihabitans arboris]|uniref:Uncharacterized protein n=1 Tax=Acerihabitans arboris TaxID=2691583 RepID=A0A845SIR9_9GAMM|nr:retron St85 family effector protein [Acerihabitans arboris]NDL65073.1 hypothetical protein [Acerihabitans arboris]
MFEETITKVFSQLDIDNFNVDLSQRFLFLCGGIINVRSMIPASFRDRILGYTATKEPQLHDYFVLAENFKDYFKENTYPDLLVFEDDIASISTLILIFLESPGSLVELGIFCNKPNFYKKLLIIAPQHETEKEDSFIYLGPIEYIKRKDSTSVAIFPWPDERVADYEEDHLYDLCEQIKSKLALIPKSEKFDKNISGHIALLVCEIITLCFPIQLSEIEQALNSININSSSKMISRYIYLLQKMGLVKQIAYSTNKYFYPAKKENKRIRFGKTLKNEIIDNMKIFMSVRQSFIDSNDPLSRRRKTVLKLIKDVLAKGDER